jgi:hypothetical protein
MTTFLVRDPRNPSKVAAFGVAFRQLINKGGPEGEAIWVMEVSANVQGVVVTPSEFVYLTTLDNMDLEIQKAVEKLAARIDWTPLLPDTNEPYVDAVSPSTYDISIHDRLYIVIKDPHPSSGIDTSSIKLLLNEIDATSGIKITGTPQEYVVEWLPTKIIYEQV